MFTIAVEEDASRLYAPCPYLASKYNPQQLINECDFCGHFYAKCCQHPGEVCHHTAILYTDGACSNNGKPSAVSGLGIAFGSQKGDPEDKNTCQFSIPVDDNVDPGCRRTSQRAELLAALEGLKKFGNRFEDQISKQCNWDSSPPRVIITSDSEYVVKGMTEWLPNWKKNHLRKANGELPLNIDLFCRLDAEVKEQECVHAFEVKFWHVNRTFNVIADELAKEGARAAANAVNDKLETLMSVVCIF